MTVSSNRRSGKTKREGLNRSTNHSEKGGHMSEKKPQDLLVDRHLATLLGNSRERIAFPDGKSLKEVDRATTGPPTPKPKDTISKNEEKRNKRR